MRISVDAFAAGQEGIFTESMGLGDLDHGNVCAQHALCTTSDSPGVVIRI